MSKYLKWQEKNISDFSDKHINSLYNEGMVFTRTGRGDMYETRSVRVDLAKFNLSSENRRILRKTENLKIEVAPIPLSDYSWKIGKMGKDFYETKFGAGVFSANKIKELLTDEEKSNFNRVLTYCHSLSRLGETKNPLNDEKGSFPAWAGQDDKTVIGYAICFANDDMLHYSYPFYSLTPNTLNLIPNLGIGMMTKAIVWAKDNRKKYVYLGSAKNSAAIYKFQFSGVEWWDGKKWQTNSDELKNILTHV